MESAIRIQENVEKIDRNINELIKIKLNISASDPNGKLEDILVAIFNTLSTSIELLEEILDQDDSLINSKELKFRLFNDWLNLRHESKNKYQIFLHKYVKQDEIPLREFYKTILRINEFISRLKSIKKELYNGFLSEDADLWLSCLLRTLDKSISEIEYIFDESKDII